MRVASFALGWFLLCALAPAARGQRSETSSRRYPSAAPIQGAVQLEQWAEQRLKGKPPISRHASVSVEVEQSGDSLRVTWPSALLTSADDEARKKDEAPSNSLREAMVELDPSRLHHLLDQESVLESLIEGATLKETSATLWEGQEARLSVYAFKPRLSDYDANYLRQATGTLRIWTRAADGRPLASEAKVEYSGKTSRFFGRIQSTQRTETRYEVVKDHLVVIRRVVEEERSASDGAEVNIRKKIFSLRFS